MYRKALVTGGAGFIGSHLTRALLDAGLEVTVLDNLAMGKAENVPDGARLLVGDVRSAADVQNALAAADIVFHEAARVSIRASIEHFYDDADTNFMGTLNLLRQLNGSRVRRLVLASSMAVYADSADPVPIDEGYGTVPISPYGIAKLAAEKYCLQLAEVLGIDCQILRYFNTYGPGQTYTPYVGVITIFIRRLLAGEAPVIYGDGEQRRDFVHVSDIVAANLLTLNAPAGSAVYNVGSGRATSVNEIAAMLCARIAPALEPAHAPAVAGELRNSIADVGSIARALGYQPRVRLSDEIDAVIAAVRATA